MNIPEGWKLVPVEPTKEMMAAGWDSTPLEMEGMTDADFGMAYKNMLSAAPTPPEVSGLREVSGVEEIKELAAASGKRTLALLSTSPEVEPVGTINRVEMFDRLLISVDLNSVGESLSDGALVYASPSSHKPLKDEP